MSKTLTKIDSDNITDSNTVSFDDNTSDNISNISSESSDIEIVNLSPDNASSSQSVNDTLINSSGSVSKSFNNNSTVFNSDSSKLLHTKRFDFIPEYARAYLFYLINVRNLSEKTVYEYYLDLRTFFRFVSQLKNITNEDIFDLIDASVCPVNIIEHLTLSELYNYLNFVREDRDNGVLARMRKISSLKSFYKYLTKNSIIDNNPTLYLESPKNPKRLPVNLSLEDSVKLLNSIDGPYKERNFAIITLFLNCGLRLAELVGMNLTSINGNVLRIVGKGNKERIVYLNQSCVDAITDYLKVRPDIQSKDKNALFISREGNRISRRMVQTVVENSIKKSGLDPSVYSTHKLRHTAATLMYQNGVDVRVLQEILGHENLGTTQIYTHISDKQVEKALNSNPLNDIKK